MARPILYNLPAPRKGEAGVTLGAFCARLKLQCRNVARIATGKTEANAGPETIIDPYETALAIGFGPKGAACIRDGLTGADTLLDEIAAAILVGNYKSRPSPNAMRVMIDTGRAPIPDVATVAADGVRLWSRKNLMQWLLDNTGRPAGNQHAGEVAGQGREVKGPSWTEKPTRVC